jgi:hypothetical protein
MKSSINSNDSTRKQAALDQVTLKKLLHYDPETGIFTWLVARSNRVKVGDITGKPTTSAYGRIGIGDRKYRAHRLAWLYMTGEWPVFQIDHKDTNKMNNKWDNLRQATSVQNRGNVRVRSKIGFKGVRKKGKRYAAHLGQTYLGTFDTPEEASKAYEAAAKEYYGEFARIE